MKSSNPCAIFRMSFLVGTLGILLVLLILYWTIWCSYFFSRKAVDILINSNLLSLIIMVFYSSDAVKSIDSILQISYPWSKAYHAAIKVNCLVKFPNCSTISWGLIYGSFTHHMLYGSAFAIEKSFCFINGGIGSNPSGGVPMIKFDTWGVIRPLVGFRCILMVLKYRESSSAMW